MRKHLWPIVWSFLCQYPIVISFCSQWQGRSYSILCVWHALFILISRNILHRHGCKILNDLTPNHIYTITPSLVNWVFEICFLSLALEPNFVIYRHEQNFIMNLNMHREHWKHSASYNTYWKAGSDADKKKKCSNQKLLGHGTGPCLEHK